jgi:hypothetical protein
VLRQEGLAAGVAGAATTSAAPAQTPSRAIAEPAHARIIRRIDGYPR